jgi:hypothetical protein
LDGLLQGAAGLGQRMVAPGLLIALDDGLHRRLHKEDLVVAAMSWSLSKASNRPSKVCPPRISGDQHHLVVPARRGHAQLRKLGDQRGGHVVHHVVAHILQKEAALLFPAPDRPEIRINFIAGVLFSLRYPES